MTNGGPPAPLRTAPVAHHGSDRQSVGDRRSSFAARTSSTRDVDRCRWRRQDTPGLRSRPNVELSSHGGRTGGIVDAASVAGLIANRVRVPTDSRTDPLVVVADRIDDEDWLVLLDTCEHLVEVVAEIAGRLLGRCPSLRILATSRQPLHLGGEVVWPVPLLELPDPGQHRVRPKWGRRRPSGCSSSARAVANRLSSSMTPTPSRSRRSAPHSTACRWRSSWPPHVSVCCRRPHCTIDYATRFTLLTGGPRDAVGTSAFSAGHRRMERRSTRAARTNIPRRPRRLCRQLQP